MSQNGAIKQPTVPSKGWDKPKFLSKRGERFDAPINPPMQTYDDIDRFRLGWVQNLFKQVMIWVKQLQVMTQVECVEKIAA